MVISLTVPISREVLKKKKQQAAPLPPLKRKPQDKGIKFGVSVRN